MKSRWVDPDPILIQAARGVPRESTMTERRQVLDDIENHLDIAQWVAAHHGVAVIPSLAPYLQIGTSKGIIRAEIGDWIILGDDGEFTVQLAEETDPWSTSN